MGGLVNGMRYWHAEEWVGCVELALGEIPANLTESEQHGYS